MAGVIAQQGDVTRALALWQESLALEEQIGNVRGKAATLASMAWLAERQGEPEKARRLNLEAAQALALVHAWLDLTTVLGNLGAAEDEAAKGWLGQAYWLAVRVSVPVEETLNLAAALLTRLGLAHEAAPLLAASAVILTQRRGADHPEREQLQQASIGMLRTCAEARNVTEEKSQEWITSNGFNDPARVLPQTLAALEQMVGAQAWLFDRAQV
jgi:tetratricopeptide (TPR) repeat protein